MSEKVLNILIYIVIGFIVYRIICSIINKINLKTERRKGLNIVYKKRQGTVLNLIKNIFKYLIVGANAHLGPVLFVLCFFGSM